MLRNQSKLQSNCESFCTTPPTNGPAIKPYHATHDGPQPPQMGRAVLSEFDRTIARATIRPTPPKARPGLIRTCLIAATACAGALVIAHIAAAGPLARLEADLAHGAATYCGRC